MREPRTTPKAAIRPRVKLWLSSDDVEGVFGGGRCHLLDAINREGSLRSAAETLGISYRKAWGDLRKSEIALGIRLVDRRRGGSDGGEMCLTEIGKLWLREYKRFQAKIEKTVAVEFRDWARKVGARP